MPGSYHEGRNYIPKTSHKGKHSKGCCSYAEAGKAITRLEFRLAVRYVRMDIKARLGLIGSRRLGTI